MSATRIWSVVIVLSSAAAIGAADVASGTPVTTLPLLWFLAVCPGMPYARLTTPAGDAELLRRWVTAVGLSIAFAAVVAEVLIYSDAYSGFTTVSILAGIAVLGALLELTVVRARVRRTAALTEAGAEVALAD
jgi:hypothetical protein